jgi:hypothetical protein
VQHKAILLKKEIGMAIAWLIPFALCVTWLWLILEAWRFGGPALELTIQWNRIGEGPIEIVLSTIGTFMCLDKVYEHIRRMKDG